VCDIFEFRETKSLSERLELAVDMFGGARQWLSFVKGRGNWPGRGLGGGCCCCCVFELDWRHWEINKIQA
jgi:hypothetical protein